MGNEKLNKLLVGFIFLDIGILSTILNKDFIFNVFIFFFTDPSNPINFIANLISFFLFVSNFICLL